MDFYDKAGSILSRDNIKVNVPLSTLTTFRVGGEADYVAVPQNAEQLAELIKLCKSEKMPFFILGNGSNILASDKGYRGVIIHILPAMKSIEISGNIIKTQAGALLATVACAASKNGLTGMEFASGIPGTIGGAVYMNAGAYDGEMKNIVRKVTVMDYEGNIYDISNEDMDFSYRHSIIQEKNLIVLSAEVELEWGEQEKIDSRIKELAEARRSKQPLEYPSAGSTFKRPEGYFAGKLIMDAGLRGATVGGAQVSEKHCGFVINKNKATADDIIKLIAHIKEEVEKQFGVVLETEVKTLGEF
ncbi:MAG: UDP-N-acetylmuramate dehydrogenase [Coprococcus sp.]